MVAHRPRKAQRRRRPRAVAAWVVMLVALGAMAYEPWQSSLAASQRVDDLEAQREALIADVQRLEERQQELTDPGQLEQLAREELGLVRPGEIPYVVAAPEPTQVPDPPPATPEPLPGAPEPWYSRLWSTVRGLLG